MVKTFSEALQSDRQKLGLSQSEFAEKLNVSQQTLSKWEAGTAWPRNLKQIELAQVLAATLQDESETIKALQIIEENARSVSEFFKPEKVTTVADFVSLRERIDNSQPDIVLEAKVNQYRNNLLIDRARYRVESDPMAMMAKATSELAKAADAMQRASEQIVKAVTMLQENQINKN